MFHVKQVVALLSFFCISINVVTGQKFGVVEFAIREMPKLPAEDMHVSDFLLGTEGYDKLSHSQKAWYYWTNYSRINPKRFWDSVVQPILFIYPEFKTAYSKSLKADLYKAPSLPLLAPNFSLVAIAERHAAQLSKGNVISHTSPDGTSFQNRISRAGIRNCAGENISNGYANTILALVMLYMDEGVPELGHRKTLLNPVFSELGVGYSIRKDETVVVVQDFACAQ